jgi:hypothetical protein
MPSTYTLNNGIELIGTGEQSGTWGDTTNTNLGLLDAALDGQVTITLGAAGSSGSPNALPITDGTASNGRNRMVVFADGGDLGATAYVQLTPNDAEKIIYIRNSLSGSRSVILFQGTYNASNDYEVPAGTTAVVYFDGAGAGAVAANVFNNAYFDGLRLGSVSVTAILDEDNMASDSAAALATQQSIKAYVDSQVGTVDTLAEILAIGNTTGATDIAVDSAQKVQFRDAAIYINSSVDGQLDIVADTEIQIAATTIDVNGALDVSGTALVTGVLTTTAATVSNGGGQFNGAINVGVDDTGYDVKFFGDTASAYMLWDASADDLILGGAGGLVVAGNVDFNGDLDVDGTTNLDATNIVGAVDVTGTVTADAYALDSLALPSAGTATIFNRNTDNSLYIQTSSGNTVYLLDGSQNTMYAATPTSHSFAISNVVVNTITATESVFNETGLDRDFRVESDTNANALFVQGSDGSVGIGTSSPAARLDIRGSGAQNIYLISTSATNQTNVLASLFNDGGGYSDLKLSGLNLLFHSGASATERMLIASNGDISFYEDTGTTAKFFWDASAESLGIGTSSPSTTLDLVGNWVSNTGQLSIDTPSGETYSGLAILNNGTPKGFIYHDNIAGALDLQTFTTDALRFKTNNAERMQIDSSGGLITNPAAGGHAVFNEGGVDADFRVESDTNTHALFVDAGSDFVGVNTAEQTQGGTLNVGAVSASAVVSLLSRSATDGHTGILLFMKTPATSGNYTATADGDVLGDIRFSGVNTSLAADIGAQITVTQSGTASTTVPADMVFVTNEIQRLAIQGRASGGEVIFNDNSADCDFRVESDGNAHMLFVDAGNDQVVVGDSGNYYSKFTVVGSKTDSGNGPLNQLSVYDNSAMAANTGGSITLWGNYTTGGTQTEGASIEAVKANGTNANYQYGIWLKSRTHGGAMDSRLYMDQAQTIFNESGFDTDFRVESDTNANMLTVDASVASVGIGKFDTDSFSKGAYFNDSAGNFFHQVNTHTSTTSTHCLLYLNRQSSDGDLVEFRQADSAEGTISVSGSTVSYNGFSGRHESSGIPANTPVGTVVSTINELDVYPDNTTNIEGNIVPHKKAGQTRADHAKVEVSTSAGDPCVYGVVSEFNGDGKLIVTSVGVGSIRVTGACSKGDLLESNGDGTAKVQSDDIIRSKTIGKVTIGNSDTGVKLVACVMYCG